MIVRYIVCYECDLEAAEFSLVFISVLWKPTDVYRCELLNNAACLLVQLDSLERNETELNTIMEKKLAHQLRDVTEATARLYGNDLHIAERLLSRLLNFEAQQSGFGLTATQDAYFNEVRGRSCFVCHT